MSQVSESRRGVFRLLAGAALLPMVAKLPSPVLAAPEPLPAVVPVDLLASYIDPQILHILFDGNSRFPYLPEA